MVLGWMLRSKVSELFFVIELGLCIMNIDSGNVVESLDVAVRWEDVVLNGRVLVGGIREIWRHGV
jgi:hypothetical protein